MARPLHIVGNRRGQYLDPRWQKKRLEIMQRDEFTCQCCGSDDKTLHVHHRKYRKEAEGPWDYEDDHLVTYCDDCHAAMHSHSKRNANALFEALIRAGVETDDEVQWFVAFVDQLRYGVRDLSDRRIALAMIEEYWKNNGLADRGAA